MTALAPARPETARRRRRYTASAVSGIVAATLVLGVGELVAVPIGANSSPFFAIGNTTVDRAPQWAREFAIETFGTNDKQALFIGMTIGILVAGALLGVVERLRKLLGCTGLAVLGLISVYAALQRPIAGWTYAIPSVVGVAAAVLVLRVLVANLDAPQPDSAPEPLLPRRTFLILAGVGATAAAATWATGRYLRDRLVNVAADRADFRLPFVSNRAKAIAAGTDIGVPGATPFVTSNGTFYRIDTALQVPQLTRGEWRLRIHGTVDREITLDWDDLTARTPIERVITLTCVSNEVGGPLAGNATWIGYPIKDILEEAGVQDGADMLLSTSVDGWTSGTPLEVLRDGRDAMLAITMNGEPLPVEHGYPVRQVVPGLYGFVSATKWVIDWEVTRFDRAEAYWTKRGWGAKAPIKTASRIDVPASLAPVAPGPVLIAGTAWAQHRGIAKVEVRVDEGPWEVAQLASEYSIDTWRQWRWEWNATPGNHLVAVRATDLDGNLQVEERTPPIPGGSTGWHTRTFIVK